MAHDVASWSVRQVCDWFEGLEEAPPTSRGAAVFEEEEIDGTALLGLTENMLKDLGFEKVGHRSKMRLAIDDLRNNNNPSTPPADKPRARTKTSKPKPKETKPDKPCLPAPERLLVIEAFAGSHPVGRHFQQMIADKQQSPYSLAGYAAVEEKAEDGDKYKAPEPEALGLTSVDYLNLQPKLIDDEEAREELLRFVRLQLQSSSALDGVVVFGGPPCTRYSNAAVKVSEQQNDFTSAQDAYNNAERNLQQLSDSTGVSAADLDAARRQVEQAGRAREAAADVLVMADLEVTAADGVVGSFLSLFMDIKQECRKAPGNPPCHLVMENPYSIPDRALWNRPFMKASHLLNLPNTEAGNRVEGFTPSKTAWLNTVFQNWCTYGPQYPQKHTVIFTTLSRRALADRSCTAHCKHPDRNDHKEKVKKMQSYKSAMWPTAFVGVVLRACVEVVDPYAHL